MHTAGAFAPEVSVKPIASDGAGTAAPMAEPTAAADKDIAAATEPAATQPAAGQAKAEPASGDVAAAAPAADDKAAAAADKATAAAAHQQGTPGSSLLTATSESFDLPKPHGVAPELTAEEVRGTRAVAGLPRTRSASGCTAQPPRNICCQVLGVLLLPRPVGAG